MLCSKALRSGSPLCLNRESDFLDMKRLFAPPKFEPWDDGKLSQELNLFLSLLGNSQAYFPYRCCSHRHRGERVDVKIGHNTSYLRSRSDCGNPYLRIARENLKVNLQASGNRQCQTPTSFVPTDPRISQRASLQIFCKDPHIGDLIGIAAASPTSNGCFIFEKPVAHGNIAVKL